MKQVNDMIDDCVLCPTDNRWKLLRLYLLSSPVDRDIYLQSTSKRSVLARGFKEIII